MTDKLDLEVLKKRMGALGYYSLTWRQEDNDMGAACKYYKVIMTVAQWKAFDAARTALPALVEECERLKAAWEGTILRARENYDRAEKNDALRTRLIDMGALHLADEQSIRNLERIKEQLEVRVRELETENERLRASTCTVAPPVTRPVYAVDDDHGPVDLSDEEPDKFDVPWQARAEKAEGELEREKMRNEELGHLIANAEYELVEFDDDTEPYAIEKALAILSKLPPGSDAYSCCQVDRDEAQARVLELEGALKRAGAVADWLTIQIACGQAMARGIPAKAVRAIWLGDRIKWSDYMAWQDAVADKQRELDELIAHKPA